MHWSAHLKLMFSQDWNNKTCDKCTVLRMFKFYDNFWWCNYYVSFLADFKCAQKQYFNIHNNKLKSCFKVQTVLDLKCYKGIIAAKGYQKLSPTTIYFCSKWLLIRQIYCRRGVFCLKWWFFSNNLNLLVYFAVPY